MTSLSNTEQELLIKTFNEFLDSNRGTKENMTHTCMGKNGWGKYCFEKEIFQEFMRLYSKIIMTGINYDLHFVERPNKNKVSLLFIDIDFDHKNSDRLYVEEHITKIIKKTNKFLKNNFKISNHQLTSFVTEKPEPTKRLNTSNSYKDGFHIYYPDIPMHEKYRFYVLDHLSDLMINDKLLNGITYINDPKKIFDMSIVKSNGILMIGSKKQGCMPYKLTHVYDYYINDLGYEAYDNEELIYTLSNQQYDEEASVLPENEEITNDIEKVYNKYNGIKKDKIIEEKSNEDTNNNINNKYKKKTALEEIDISLARKLTKILNKKRASDYNSWRQIGFVLRAIDESLFDDFVEFSKKDMSKFNDGKISCNKIWEVAKDYMSCYSIGTLRHWAKLDNPDEYNKILINTYDTIFGKAETGKHVDIASIIYELYKDRFICVDINRKKWYEFQNHRWIFLKSSAYSLEELISHEFRIIMHMYCSRKMNEHASTQNSSEGFKEDNEYKKYNNLRKIVDNLGDVKFRENIIKACSNKFFKNEFIEKLDNNIYLVGFNNGVYDLKEFCFRDGLPTDFVSKTVGYDYKEFKETDPIFNKIHKYFSEVQTEEDMRTYLLTFMAKVLRGEPDSKCHIWSGGGSNGKSSTVDLIRNMLGEYFGTVPVTILTRKKGSSSGASPEMADLQGKRFVVIQEPEHNDVVHVGQMKEYTGKDTIYARPLYGDPFNYRPQFTLVLTCNRLPHIPSTDNGTWRRLRVTPYESEFVDHQPKGERQFLKDEDLQEGFTKWAQPLIWLIINKYYPIYEAGIDGKKYKIKEPAKVTEYTNNYKIESDAYAEFLDEIIEKTDNDNDCEMISFLYDLYKKWYQLSYTDKPEPKKNFIGYLKKNNYKMDKQNVYRIKYVMGIN